MEYNFSEIESKWRSKWSQDQLYKVDIDQDKPKYYVLDMFPYPSGAGLHVGHPLGYIASDIFSRYKRLSGFNVLHPMGFDAFGLPAEEYAIATGVHPAKSTGENIDRYKTQLDNIGFSFDWSREVVTCDPKYYKWTQWIFSLLFEHYFDTSSQKAEPISKLVAHFEVNGSNNSNAFSNDENSFEADDWKSMTDLQKSDILTSYRLAYRKIGYVNWCENLGTVLANDQIKDGVSERGGHPVERKAMTQWYLRTTAYAERLLNDLDSIDWSSSLKAIQRNWIGKSKGAKVFFEIENYNEKLEIFTTRPDTIFGATYMVLAPEHPFIQDIVSTEEKVKVEEYLQYVKTRSERDRMSDVKEVTGVSTGAYAINPFNLKKIPIWIGEYVLMDYGTGAIMAVPSDDDRDNAFAQKFGLEIIEVIDRSEHESAKREDKVGKLINSDFLNGMEVNDAISHICDKIESMGIGEVKINYKIRDANFSRQRYWGEPFPIIYTKDGIPTLDKNLPVELPQTEDFKPTKDGQSPLSRVEDWVNVSDGKRETDTMPAVAGSSWYYLRYMDPSNDGAIASQEALNYWDSVDLYVGGSEHAVAHLLYARFWHKFLYDLGYLPSNEPFKKLINQGMIQGVIEYLALVKSDNGDNTFYCQSMLDDQTDFSRIPVHIDFVNNYGSKDSHLTSHGIKQFVDWRPDFANAKFVTPNGSFSLSEMEGKDVTLETISEVGKMSKRYYNVVNPDDVVDKYGADTFRLYEMFLGPIEQSKPWDTQGIEGVSKFVRKFWGMFFNEDVLNVSDESPSKAELKVLHTAIKKVSDDIEKFSFNTAISAMMICVNELRKLKCNKREILEPLVKLVAPFAPFMSEELWSRLGHQESIHLQSYPKFESSHLVEDEVEYPICINGKKRMVKSFPTDASKEDMEKEALEIPELSKWTEGKTIMKVIVVPKRMINIVVK